jgi:small subunit ribosomal protein S3
MGQKIHPIGFRLGISRGWDSTWYGNKFSYSNFVKEDHKIRNKIMKVNKDAGITKIEIERSTNEVSVKIFTSRPGIVIGRGGQRIDELKKLISDITKNKTQLNIEEIRNPDLDATLVSNSIAEQIERRISYKRAARMAASRSMQNGAKGIKIICKGRLAGAEIARKEQVMEGRVPLHTLKADIDYHIAEAHTEYGRIGVKVWIYRGDIEISKQTHVEPSEIKDIELTLTPENSNPSDEKSEIEIIKGEEPTLEEPTLEEPTLEEPKAEKPKAEEPKVEEPKAAKPKAAKPKAAKPKAAKPKAEKKQPATKKKTTKKTTTKKNKEEASDDTNL